MVTEYIDTPSPVCGVCLQHSQATTNYVSKRSIIPPLNKINEKYEPVDPCLELIENSVAD